MIKLQPAVREVRRLMRQYSSAIKMDAQRRPANFGRSTLRILRARLRHGVGPMYYSLYRFSDIPESTWGDYLTDDPYFKQSLLEMSPVEMHRIAQNKALLFQHCVKEKLPTIPILCVVGTSPDPLGPEVRLVQDREQWLSALRPIPEAMFVKSIDGTYGEGSFTVTRSKKGGLEFDGTTGSLSDLYGHLRSKLRYENGWIVQPRLKSHPGLRGIVSPNGLATVRVVTAMQNGIARVLIAGFKVTVGDNITDNFSKGASGNLLAAVDLETGTLSEAWGSVRTDWPEMSSFSHHPDSGRQLKGAVLPLWTDVMNAAVRAQQSLPQLASAGWDIAISDGGVMLVEANLTYDMSILQIAHQRGLKGEIFSALSLPQPPQRTS